MTMINKDTECPEGFPEHMWGGFKRYVLDGVPPGNGLRAFLEGDLFETFRRCDFTDQLTPMVMYTCNYCPAGCFGSKSRVQEWLELGGLHGLERKMNGGN